jgi:3-oxoacyl-[acyl-carrier protein] reductase
VSEKRVLLLTGSSRGIGLGIANFFLERGYVVCGCSRSDGAIALPQYHHDRLDVSDEKAVRGWVSSVAKRFGRIDVAVCNAGIVKSALMMSVTPTAILDEFLATHVRGTFVVCREVSKVMVRQRGGRIINFSSLAVPLHLKGAAGYAATKAAVEEMTRVLAKELAPTGVTCNIVSPALVMTDPARAMGPEWAKWLLDQQSIQRTVTVEEVCNVIEFFASPASSAITGQTLNMCHVG